MRKEAQILWTIAVVLVILWLLGFVSGYAVDSVIHIPLFFAIVAMLIKSEDDCSNYGSCLTKKRYLKRHLVRRPGMVLQKVTMPSGERVSQPNISPQTYR